MNRHPVRRATHSPRKPGAWARSCISLAVAAVCLTTGVAHAQGLSEASPEALAAEGKVRVIVRFKPGAEAVALARAAVARSGGRVKLELMSGRGIAVELPKAAVAALAAHSAVERVEDDVPRYPLGLTTPSKAPYKPGQQVPYGIKMVQADQLPEQDSLATNRKICIIDSGYDNSHEDLPHATVTGYDDIGGAGPWAKDGLGHGTHVAGTIAAVNQRNVGVVGVLPNNKVSLHIIRVFGDDGFWAYSSTLANAAQRCQAAGANVINMSLGGGQPNATEREAFEALQTAGILSVAAAGNGGGSFTSYPAGYPAVMSVAAIDQKKARADFSQSNKDVEIAAPGVGVYSTVPMGTGYDNALSVDTTVFAPGVVYGSPEGSVSAPLADFGRGDKLDTAMAGRLCLTRSFNGTFTDPMDHVKLANCERSGGVGMVLYNFQPGGRFNTSAFGGTIPSLTVSKAEGEKLKQRLGQSADLSVRFSNYALEDGTSMASPHVAAVAALIWSYFPNCTGEQIRQSLNKSAADLGTPGRDNQYGFGLVQAKVAYDRIKAQGCGQ